LLPALSIHTFIIIDLLLLSSLSHYTFSSTGTKYTMDEIQSFQAQDFQFMVDEIKNLSRETMLP
jgi:hypothetical protein